MHVLVSHSQVHFNSVPRTSENFSHADVEDSESQLLVWATSMHYMVRSRYTSTRRLRIGWYVDDGFMTPTPPCQRAVHAAVEILSAAGHHVEPFDLAVLNTTEGCSGEDVSIPTAMATFFSLISSVCTRASSRTHLHTVSISFAATRTCG